DKMAETKLATAKQVALGKVRIDGYVEKNHINVSPHSNGTYLEIIQAGTGLPLKKSDKIAVDFNVKTLTGKLLHTSSDSTNKPVQIVMGDEFFPPIIQPHLEGIT